jgi:4-deoxy-L-threo-5-hexosulose-uronate ketol-isomerase
MSDKIRFSKSADETKNFNTTQLRQNFLIETVFKPDEITCTYSMQDRFMILGIQPVQKTISLPAFESLTKAAFFLERREIGILNAGGTGRIIINGEMFLMNNKDVLYIGRGNQNIVFESVNAAQPALFYANSCTAHASHPTVQIPKTMIKPLELGDFSTANKRLIYFKQKRRLSPKNGGYLRKMAAISVKWRLSP